MADDEKKLIKKIKKGNQQAFQKLYQLHVDYALRTAYAISKNKNDASDIVQETFIRVFRNIDSYDINRPFRAWLYRILINESNRLLRKRTRSEVTIDSEQLLDYLGRQSTQSKPLDELDEAIDELEEHHKTVIILKYLNGFSEKEIAEILGLNQNTVKSRLYQARNKLRSKLGGREHEWE